MRNVMAGLRDDQRIDLQIIVTGSHLAKGHGNTINEIIQDGFTLSEEVDFLLASDSSCATGLSLGLGIIGLTSALSRLKPDPIVLLGDRYEALAAAQSAMMLGIPIAHIHGGETTEGAIDEAVRHAIAKMSHLHFPATDTFRNRILQLAALELMLSTSNSVLALTMKMAKLRTKNVTRTVVIPKTTIIKQ